MAAIKDLVVGRKEMFMVDPKVIVVRPNWNPRLNFDSEEDRELHQFVMDNGATFPPIYVKKVNEKIELIDGERRLRATLKAINSGCAIEKIPAIFMEPTANDIDQLSLAMTANQGKPFTPMEEATACKRLLNWGLTEAQIASKIGKSPSHVSNRLVLVNASPAVAAAVSAGIITQGEAMETIKKAEGSIDKQDDTLKRIAKPSAGKAQKMMSRLKLQGQMDELMKRAIDSGLEFNAMEEEAVLEGVLIGMTMVLKNMTLVDATSEVFINFKEASVKF